MPTLEQPKAHNSVRLPADIWGAIARATLRAEGGTAHAWERLSRVNSTWRAGLKGMSQSARCTQPEVARHYFRAHGGPTSMC